MVPLVIGFDQSPRSSGRPHRIVMKETINISGMSCDGCVNSVRKALSHLPLNESSVELGKAEIEYDEKMVNRKQIIAAIEDAGFEVDNNY